MLFISSSLDMLQKLACGIPLLFINAGHAVTLTSEFLIRWWLMTPYLLEGLPDTKLDHDEEFYHGYIKSLLSNTVPKNLSDYSLVVQESADDVISV